MSPTACARQATAADAPIGAWSRLLEALPDAAWLVDAGSLRVIAANRASARLFGMSMAGAGMLDASATPEDACFWREAAAGCADGIVSDTLAQRADGSLLPVTRSARRIDHGGMAARDDVFLVVFHDLSERRRAERDAEALVADLRATLESTADAILVTDLDGRMRCHNQRFAALWKLPPELLARRDDAALDDWMRRAVADPEPYVARLAAIRAGVFLQASDVFELRSGRTVERVALPQLSHGLPVGRVYSFRDVTERLEATRRIEALSRTDALTGLPNRRAFADRVERALAAGGAQTFALVFLDLDRFKHVNDSLGHLAGDRVLVEASGRIGRCLRPGDVLARLGGDEFVMLVHRADADGAELVARRVLAAMARPFVQGSSSFRVTCSMGISLHPAHGTSLDELMRHADTAMYGVKHGGRAGFRLHRPHAPADLPPRMRTHRAGPRGGGRRTIASLPPYRRRKALAMIYKFKSKAAGDVIMLKPNGDHVLRIVGKEPAGRGIITVAEMPAAISALEAAIRRETQQQEDEDTPAAERQVSLKQRAWPLVEMLRESLAGKADVVWGV